MHSLLLTSLSPLRPNRREGSLALGVGWGAGAEVSAGRVAEGWAQCIRSRREDTWQGQGAGCEMRPGKEEEGDQGAQSCAELADVANNYMGPLGCPW